MSNQNSKRSEKTRITCRAIWLMIQEAALGRIDAGFGRGLRGPRCRV